MNDNEGVIYTTVNLTEMIFQDESFYYPCPCGDLFEISLADVMNGYRIALCPTCSLRVAVNVVEEELEEFCGSQNIPATSLRFLGSTETTASLQHVFF
jgi:diphthamide biosynthesis protein 3